MSTSSNDTPEIRQLEQSLAARLEALAGLRRQIIQGLEATYRQFLPKAMSDRVEAEPDVIKRLHETGRLAALRQEAKALEAHVAKVLEDALAPAELWYQPGARDTDDITWTTRITAYDPRHLIPARTWNAARAPLGQFQMMLRTYGFAYVPDDMPTLFPGLLEAVQEYRATAQAAAELAKKVEQARQKQAAAEAKSLWDSV